MFNSLLSTNLSRHTLGLDMRPCIPGQYRAARWVTVRSGNFPAPAPPPAWARLWDKYGLDKPNLELMIN